MTTPTPSTTALTDELRTWPGAALVLDPHGRIFAATADERARSGPVYRIPDHRIDIATLFDLTAAQDVATLHAALLGSAQDGDPSFAARSLPLMHAAIAAGNATGEHPLHVLARWTDMAAPRALREAQHYAPAAVRQFTSSDDPHVDRLSRFAQSAWGTLVTRLSVLHPHLALLTRADIPTDWHQRQATVYVTLARDPRTSALLNCIIHGFLWAMQRHPAQPPVLLVLDDGVPPLHLMVDHTHRGHAIFANTSTIVPSVALAHTVLANGHTRLILSTDTTAQTDPGEARTGASRGRST